MRGLMGTFALMPLQDVVEFLARRQVTGNLTCERGTVRKTIHLIDGVAVGASSNDPREYLGQLLTNFGHITEEQLTKAFETQAETKIRLGKVLTMVGLVSEEVVRDTLAIKIRETLLDALVWDSGLFRVEETPPMHIDDLDARVALSEIAREAEFRTTAWRAFRSQFPTGTASIYVNEERIPPDIEEDGIDGRLLALARDGKTIDEIGLTLHLTDFHLYQRLYALHRQELIGVALPLLDAEPAEEKVRAPPDAARQVELLRAALLDKPRTPRLKVSVHDLKLMRLSQAEKYLLLRCDGSRDLSRILELSPVTEIEALQAIQKFLEGRVLEFVA